GRGLLLLACLPDPGAKQRHGQAGGRVQKDTTHWQTSFATGPRRDGPRSKLAAGSGGELPPTMVRRTPAHGGLPFYALVTKPPRRRRLALGPPSPRRLWHRLPPV